MDIPTLGELWASGPVVQALMVSVGSLLAALLTSFGFTRIVLRLTRQTETELDDLVFEKLRMPTAVTVALVGLWYATTFLDLPEPMPFFTRGFLMTSTALVWGLRGSAVVSLVLDGLVKNRARYPTIVTDRTEPLFDIVGKTAVYAASIYLLFLAWDVDLTAWLASAGVIGIAVGFASQDTLSNLVAGVFILADSPYKLGDFLILESGLRGRVTEIGMRTTRILTNDDVEVIVPNQVMANSQIVNESGGPHEKFRIRVAIGVAYGSDVDQVRRCLLEEARQVRGVVKRPFPVVRFMSFGDSSLDFEVQTWVEEPRLAERVLDEVNTRIYKRLAAEDIEIPFPKRDVYLYPQGPAS